MKSHDSARHPGPWRMMRVDSEFVGLLIAVGFVLMGLVSTPTVTWFVLGAIFLGVTVALLLRLKR
jgi:membrane protein YdbS with pleckstrin-like domain